MASVAAFPLELAGVLLRALARAAADGLQSYRQRCAVGMPGMFTTDEFR
jgi:hypothetical protein